jgi:hypothetical protein
MKSSALIALAVLIAAHAAQAAESPKSPGGSPSGPPVTHFQGSCESDPDGKKFAAKACYLARNYYPKNSIVGGKYHRPTCGAKSVTARQRRILARTYTRAPDYMKAKLCRLTQLFVTRVQPWGPWGWGFWEGPDHPPGTSVYVAISDADLGSKKPLADSENETAQRLLGTGERGGYYGRHLLRLKDAASADPELTVLGELAHELGHALLADANADGIDEKHPRRQVSGPPRSACFGDAFLGSSWNPASFYMTRWVDFGEQYGNQQKNPNVEFSLKRLKSAALRGRLDTASDAIRNVYRSKEFVSFAAAVNPIEDFVETYKYKVLVDASPKQSIAFRLGRQEINIADLLDSGIPEGKVKCLRDLGLLEGTP